MATANLLRCALLAASLWSMLQMHLTGEEHEAVLTVNGKQLATDVVHKPCSTPPSDDSNEEWSPPVQRTATSTDPLLTNKDDVCFPENRLQADLSIVASSNLCNQGPDRGEEGLRILNVFPARRNPVDLHITCHAVGEYYTSNPERNGVMDLSDKSPRLWAVDVEGSAAKLRFTFVDRAGDPVEPGPFAFSVVDLDSDGGPKGFNVTGFTDFVTTAGTKVEHHIDHIKERVAFHGARDPRRRWNSMVSLLFPENTSGFDITLTLGTGRPTSTFAFTGQTALVCPEVLAKCAGYQCPAGFDPRQDAEQRPCAGDQCNRNECCVAQARRGCPSKDLSSAELDFRQKALVTSNLGSMGPHRGSASEMLISNVFPNMDNTHGGPVDLRITAQHGYKPLHPSENGITQDGMLTINVNCGETAMLDFEFLDRSDAGLHSDTFMITFLGLGKNGSVTGQVATKDIVQHFLENDTQIVGTHPIAGTTVFSFDGEAKFKFAGVRFNMSEEDRVQAVQAMVDAKSKFTVNLTVPALAVKHRGCSRTFFIAGPSSLGCPKRQACTEYRCPPGRSLKRNAHQIPCQTEVCDDFDLETCCIDVARTLWSHSSLTTKFMPNNLLYSNLFGKGPDRGKPRSLLLGDVFPREKRTIDLLIEPLGDYTASNTAANTLIGDMLQINVLGSTRLKFRFFDRAANKLANLSSFYLSFLGLHATGDGGGMKRVRMYTESFKKFELSRNSSVELTKYGTFGSRKLQEPWIPEGSRALTSEQMDTSVTLLMKDEPEFEVEFEVRGAAKSANFLIAGCSNIACPGRQTCEEFRCPHRHQQKRNAKFIDCAGPMCGDEDITSCCDEVPPTECLEGIMLDVSKDKVILDNFGRHGRNLIPWNGLLIGDVFPDANRTIDLEITPIGNFNLAEKHTTGATGSMIAVGVEAGGSVDLNFRFFDRETQDLVTAPAFYFTVGDLRPRSTGFLNVSIPEGSLAFVSPVSKVVVHSMQHFSTSKGESAATVPINLMALDQVQEQAVVTTRIEPTSSFRVLMSASKETSGHTFQLGGASSLVCPRQAMCTMMACPYGFTLKETAKHTTCLGHHCRSNKDIEQCCTTKVPDLCDDRARMHITRDSVLYSNLNNNGPDYNRPEGILLGNVFDHISDPIDLHITGGSDYAPSVSSLNKELDDMLSINILSGQKARLNFSFINRTSGKSRNISAFYFTFADFDSIDDTGRAVVEVLTPFVKATYGTPQFIHRHENSFISGPVNGVQMNATANPLALSPEQMNLTVTLLFENVSQIALEVGNSRSTKGGRTWRFAGASSLVCEARARCSTFICPPRHSRRADAESIVCKGNKCTEADMASCCIEEVSNRACHEESRLNLDRAVVLHSNLGGQGPHFGGKPLLVIGDVFPANDSIIDMVIGVAEKGGYLAPRGSSNGNGVSSSMGRISLQANTSAELEIEFVDRATGVPANVPSFFMSFLPDSHNADGRTQTVSVPDIEAYEVSPGNVTVTGDDTFTTSASVQDVTNLLGMHPHELPGMTTVTMPSSENSGGRYTLKLSTRGGTTAKHFRFGGPSTLSCSRRASCSRFVCPGGFKQKSNAMHLLCSGPVCSNSDVHTCCSTVNEVEGCTPDARLALAPSRALYMNLGGYGPDTCAPEGILFGDVFPDSGDRVDLQVNSLKTFEQGEAWTTDSATKGTVQIGLVPGMLLPLKFSFVNRSGDPVEVPSFWFSVLGLTTLSGQESHTGEMVVEMHKFTNFQMYDDSPVLAMGHTFRSGQVPNFVDEPHPVNPLALSHTLMQQSVAFKMTQGSFKVNFTAMPGPQPRTFTFAGASSLTCPRKAACNTYICPTGYDSRGEMATCAGVTCKDEDDLLTCCKKQDNHACALARIFSLRVSHQSYSNLALTEERTPPGILYRNVFPQAASTVDLRLLAREKFSSQPSRNQVVNGLARINVGYNSTVDLEFEFIDKDGHAVPSEGDFYFSFHGLGLSSAVETVEVHSGILDYSVSDMDAVNMSHIGDRPVFTTKPAEGKGEGAASGAALMLLLPTETSRFNLTLTVSNAHTNCSTTDESCKNGVDFHFGDAQEVFCETRSPCSSFQCPSPYTLRRNIESVLCGDAICGAEDMNRCCEIS